MEDVYSDLNDFDKRLKANRNLEDQNESSSDDEASGQPRITTEADILREKNRILMEKLFKVDKQMNEYKETLEAIQGSGKTDNKDKKIIDLAKKNRALQLQVESLKTKAAKAAEIAIKFKNERDQEEQDTSSMAGGKSANMTGYPTDTMSMMTGVESDKKVKDLEKKITKMRNENQQLKQDLEKAIKVIEREIGEVVNVDDMLREGSTWKGRAQKIDVLQTKIKKLKADLGQGGGASVMNDGLSVISEVPSMSVFTGKITHAEKNLTKLDSNKTKELESVKKELEETKEELNSLKNKYKAAVARRDTLENQMKDIKTEFGSKIKILLEKTENDDKLIQALKSEIKRLETAKGVKSQLSGGPKQLGAAGGGSSSTIEISELTKFKAENSRLKNQVKCLDIELEQKEEKIKLLLTNCIGAPDEQLEEKELRIAELEERVEQLEKENFRVKQDMKQSKQGFGKSAGPERTKDESDNIIKDLSKQNAILRRKLDDALDKLGQTSGSQGFKQ